MKKNNGLYFDCNDW